ncbi:Short repeat of unknown function [Lachnospiraceae bacterium XBB1006]|nr:Short repeat of unknown function [Lachnospiraceae bacterium XBB1006]
MQKQTSYMVPTVAAIAAILGAVLLFVPQISLDKICYLMCGAIVAGGVYAIVHYFITNGFADEQDYGFSVGVFLLVVGILGFIKTPEIILFFPVALSILALVYGVMVLQDALDLKRMQSSLWYGSLAGALLIHGVAIVVLIYPFEQELRATISYGMILGTGIVLVASKILRRIGQKKDNKEELMGIE